LSFVEEFSLCTGVDNLSLSNRNFLQMAFKKSVTNINRIYTYIPFYLFILFPYIPFRYIPWKWKTSYSIYIIRQLAHGIISIAKVEKYL
jgi:hypothetical protein